MKKLQKIITAGAIIASLSGCSTNPVDDIEPDMPNYNNKEKFLLGNWGSIPQANTGYMEYADNPNYSTTENWKNLKDCGFNTIVSGGYSDVNRNINDLEMCDEAGLDVLLRDLSTNSIETLIKFCIQKSDWGYKECFDYFNSKTNDIKATIDRYTSHKSFVGIDAFDEPNTDYYDAIAAAQDWFLKNYPEYVFYTNLLPVYATNKQLFGSSSSKGYTYEDYVKMFAEDVNPAMLSYDHYPILTDYDESLYIKDDFLYNLNVVARQAKVSKVPAYIYIQAMGFYSNAPITTYEEFAWQVYTSLAFGFKGILTFQYWTQLQAEYHNNVRHGIVERDGTLNEIYYEVQKIFSNITKMEDVYMSYTWDGAKTIEAGRVVNEQFDMIQKDTLLTSLHDINKVSTSHDLIVGQFKNKQNQYAYMVTNASSPWEKETANVSLTMPNYKYAMIIQKDERKMVKLENNILTIDIACGDGTFVVPVK